MPLQIDLHRDYLIDAIESKIDMYERRIKAETNQLIKQILSKDVLALQAAKLSIHEVDPTKDNAVKLK